MPGIANNRRTQIQGNLRKGKTFGEKLDPGFAPKRSPLKPLKGLGLGSPRAAASSLSGAGGLSGNAQAGLGAQLSHKVSSGALTQQQAQKVAAQRAVLEKVYGPDWRTRVFGKGGAKARSGPFARSQNNAARNKALAAVKNKAVGNKFSGLGKY